jgi:hypothetical protein
MHDMIGLLDSNVLRTLLAVLGIVVSVTIYRLNKKRKELSYDIVRNAKLFLLNDELKSRVQVALDGKPVNDLSLAIIDIANTGNEPIQKDDFDKPFTLKFGSEAEIISARILGAKPDDLDVHLSTNASDVILQPLLLNKGDGMTIEVLTAESSTKISHSARIVGIPEVKSSIKQPLSTWEKIFRLLLVIYGVFLLVMLWRTLALQFRRNVWVFSARIDISILMLSLIFGLIAAVTLVRSRRSKAW